MRRLILCLALLMVISMIPMAMADNDHHDHRFRVRTHLSGFNEVHFAGGSAGPPFVPATLRGAVSTGASGKFVATIDEEDRHHPLRAELQEPGRHCYTRAYSLWSAAHGRRHRGLALPDSGYACSGCRCRRNALLSWPEGTVKGTITPAKVLAQTLQGIAGSGNFDELVDAIRAGTTYANVHTTLFTPGEIRGQIPGSHDD